MAYNLDALDASVQERGDAGYNLDALDESMQGESTRAKRLAASAPAVQRNLYRINEDVGTDLAPVDTGITGMVGGAAAEGFGRIGASLEDLGRGAYQGVRNMLVPNPMQAPPEVSGIPQRAPLTQPLIDWGQQQQELSATQGLPRFAAGFAGQAIPYSAGALATGGVLPEVEAGLPVMQRLGQLALRSGVENAVPSAAMAPPGQRADAGALGFGLGVALSPAGLMAKGRQPLNTVESLPPERQFIDPRETNVKPPPQGLLPGGNPAQRQLIAPTAATPPVGIDDTTLPKRDPLATVAQNIQTKSKKGANANGYEEIQQVGAEEAGQPAQGLDQRPQADVRERAGTPPEQDHEEGLLTPERGAQGGGIDQTAPPAQGYSLDALDQVATQPAVGSVQSAQEPSQSLEAIQGPRAVFKGWQQGFGSVPDQPLYNVEGEHRLAGSTVGPETLQQAGIEVPETPPNPYAKEGQANASEIESTAGVHGNGEQSGGALEARGGGQEVAAGSGSQGIRPQAPAQAPKGTLNELPRPQGSTQREYKAWKSKLSPEDAARHTAWEKRLDAEIQAGAPERAARSAGLDAAIEKRRATWPGNKAMADKVQKQLADAGIQATRHEADTGSIYFDLPSGEKIRIADHAAPRGGGFSIEQQSRMGEAKYDLNAEGVREGMRGPIDLPPHDDQIAQAIRDEAPGAQGEVGPAVGDHVQWTSLGVDQFETPKRIESIQEHEGKQYAMLEGEKGGVPLDQLSKQELPEPPTAPKTEVQPEGEPELTSLRKGDIDAARERIGLNRIDGLEKKSFAEADAKAKHSNLKGKAHEMAQEVLTGDKRLTMEETAGMAHRITEINNRRAFLQDRIDNKATDPAQRTFDVGELEKGQQEADTIWQAVRQSGRASGQENAIKAAAWDSEGNLTAQLAMAREAKGADLTPKEVAGLKKLVAERDATIAAHEKEIERLKTEKASSVLQRKARSKVTRSAKSYEESFSKVRDLLRAGCGR